MPKKLYTRNKAIIQLLKLGWTKHAVAQLFQKFGWGKSAIYLVMRRDWDKYNLPTSDELKEISDKYHISIKEFNSKVVLEN